MRQISLLLFFVCFSLPLNAVEVRVLIGKGKGEIFCPEGGLVVVNQVETSVCFGDGKSLVYYQNCPYRGRICVVKRGRDRFVINELDVEDYVKGVLYNEISHYWPMEALKAQAVVARTYALYQMFSSSGERIFDLKNDQSSQVYRGYNSERFRTNLAVDQTKGEVLISIDSGELFPAFYHACCGGRTELPQEVWTGDFKCQFEVVRDPYCRFSPYRNWKLELDIEKFIHLLAGFGVRGGEIKHISVVEYTISGRARTLLVITDKGQYLIPASKMRMVLGPGKLKSTLFKVRAIGRKVIFEGHGWGHGVGMCQWGAYNMALKGYTYEEILRFYYPHAVISDINEVVSRYGEGRKLACSNNNGR